MNTKELINRIFKEPGVKFELTEFENLGKPINDIITNRDVAKRVVPSISRSFHDEITALVRKSIDSKEESKRLLEQAKARVEQLIEEAAQP